MIHNLNEYLLNLIPIINFADFYIEQLIIAKSNRITIFFV